MSVIAVKKFEDHVGIAADTQITAEGGRIMTAAKFKLIEHEGITIGFSGDAAIANFLRLYLVNTEVPKVSLADIGAFIVSFYDYVSTITVEDYNILGSSFIFASHDRVVAVEDYFTSDVEDTYSIGTGMELCEAMMKKGATPTQVVEEVCKVSIFCSPPIEEYRIYADKMEYKVYE